MYLIQFISLSFFLLFGQCRDLWSENLPDGPEVLLEKNKPIHLPNNYTKVRLCKLEGTLYSDSLSRLDGINELNICRHQLHKIEDGALCSSSIKVLDIDFFDNVHNLSLTKETFGNCQHLEELLLKFDNLYPATTLEENAFEDLTSLKKLAIQGYELNHLTAKFLNVPSDNLKELVLSFNGILDIEAGVFDNLRNLETLYIIHNNRLKGFPKNLFRNLNELKLLNLRDNALRNLTWDEFNGLSSLEELSVVDNDISSFDADKIAENLPNLKKFSFYLNRGPCKPDQFAENLKMKYKHPIEVEYEQVPGLDRSCGQNL